MIYNFMHYFDHYSYEGRGYLLSDEQKLEIAKRKAAEDLAKELLKHSVFEVDDNGNVRGMIEV